MGPELDRYDSYHLIGIGGSGMSGLARLLLGEGRRVSGSDRTESDTTRRLRRAGARIAIGHDAANLEDAGCVIYTAAVKEDNPELAEARRRRIPLYPRAALLGQVMSRKRSIAVSGTHGKTTVTCMAASVFRAASADPSVLVGAEWGEIDGNAWAGRGRHFIAEACEAYSSFLNIHPDIALITNVEADHLDHFADLAGVLRVFHRFLAQVKPGGFAVGCGDDANVRSLLEVAACRTVTYGFMEGVDYRILDSNDEGPHPVFSLEARGRPCGPFRLGVAGRHNMLNAAGVAALALEERLPDTAIAEGLKRFSGAGRRMELLGEAAGVRVMDDYAHHPTEVRATLQALKQAYGRPLLVVFQPHLFSRTREMAADFARSFGDAGRLVITAIYPAREEPLPGITGEWLAAQVREAAPELDVRQIDGGRELLDHLVAAAQPGDLVVVMGAGDIVDTGRALLRRLQEKE